VFAKFSVVVFWKLRIKPEKKAGDTDKSGATDKLAFADIESYEMQSRATLGRAEKVRLSRAFLLMEGSYGH
jgi:uncharacterized Rmd1/YagE family protein